MKKVVSMALALAAVFSVSAEARMNTLFYSRDAQLAHIDAMLSGSGRDANSNLQYYGGPVLSHAKIYAVMWTKAVDANVQNNMGKILTGLTNSTAMDMLAQYATTVRATTGQPGTNQQIGRGSYGGMYTIQPANTSTSLADADVGAELEAQINAGKLPKPDADSVYMVYFPAGITITLDGAQSCQAFCGYHHSVKTKNYGGVYFGVIPDLGGACSYGCGFVDNPVDNYAVVTSHEVTEAITDPAVDPQGDFGPPIAWVTSQGQEIGDLCASQFTKLNFPDGTSVQVQQEYDNSLNGCNPGPFVVGK
jgi:hypothetical protein